MFDHFVVALLFQLILQLFDFVVLFAQNFFQLRKKKKRKKLIINLKFYRNPTQLNPFFNA